MATATKKSRANEAPVRVDTAIHILLDRSGSMNRSRLNTIEGFNKFLVEQRELEGVATISLAQFDNMYEPNYTNVPLAEAPYLTEETYVPRGGTALNDAIARSIADFGASIKASKPKQVLFVILTDGYENASAEYPGMGNRDLLKLIETMHDKHKWQFVYLGAQIDAVEVSQGIGGQAFAAASTPYAANAAGTQAAWSTLSHSTRSYRSAGVAQAAAFISDDDRKALEKQMEGGSDVGNVS